MSSDLLVWAAGLLVTFVWLAVVMFAVYLAGMNRRTKATPPRPPAPADTEGEDKP